MVKQENKHKTNSKINKNQHFHIKNNMMPVTTLLLSGTTDYSAHNLKGDYKKEVRKLGS